jgi:hypothetical protein
MSTYKPQGKNAPINSETSPGDKLEETRKMGQEMEAKVTAKALDLMRRGSGGSQN